MQAKKAISKKSLSKSKGKKTQQQQKKTNEAIRKSD